MSINDFLKRRNLRKQLASAWKHVALLHNMRRDILPPDQLAALEAIRATLQQARRSGDTASMEAALEEAATVCTRIAPSTKKLRGLGELTDTLVVAFGVAMAFRAYYFQPFKIPTNSMVPTLYGIHSVGVDANGKPFAPTFWDEQPFKFFKWLATGESYLDVTAHEAGKVVVYDDSARAPGYVIVQVSGAKYKIPQDALFRKDALGGPEVRVPNQRPPGMADVGGRPVQMIAEGYVRTGDRIWSGYVLSGDQVFVNRFKWYFAPPKRGQTIVFATDGIPHLQPGMFYIKRLTGLPNETISFHADTNTPCLMVNGQPLDATNPETPYTLLREAERRQAWPDTPTYLGVESAPLTFLFGRSKILHPPRYPGYRYIGSETYPPAGIERCPLGIPGDALALGPDDFLALGDNTPSSYDSRFWGPVPRHRLVGPASLIYWPPSPRWGRVK